MRVALYCRVSTEEQANYGFSIQAQKDSLLTYASKNNYTVVDVYSDEGVSGGRIDRPALNRLLDDVRSNKIDMILFIKLDRWFRSVAHYYKIQDVLEQYNVVWRTTEEEYETETSSGKFKVNIMLSVSQQMKDATSERIKFVFDSKIKHGGALNGNQPLGYMVSSIDGKKVVVKNPSESAIVNDIFDYYELHQNLSETVSYVNSKYGFHKTPTLLKRMFINPIYYGSKRGFDNYCEPYLSKERWDHIQDILKSKNIKTNTKVDYIFSGLLICSGCNRRLSGKSCKRPYGYTYYYRCNWYVLNKTCSQSHIIQESILENDVINYINNFVSRSCKDYDFIQIEEEEQVDNKKLEKLSIQKDKVTKAFINGWISEDDANAEHRKINLEIDKIKSKKSKIKKATTLDSDWLSMYNSLSRKGKQMFLHSIIDKIIIDSDKYIVRDPDYFTIYFL